MSWPDKTEGYTHCLLVVAGDQAALKGYLHSDEHLKEWMPAVKPYFEGIIDFDTVLEPALVSALSATAIPHTVFFKFPSIAGEVPVALAEVVARFNALPGIAAQFAPHGVGIEGAT